MEENGEFNHIRKQEEIMEAENESLESGNRNIRWEGLVIRLDLRAPPWQRADLVRGSTVTLRILERFKQRPLWVDEAPDEP